MIICSIALTRAEGVVSPQKIILLSEPLQSWPVLTSGLAYPIWLEKLCSKLQFLSKQTNFKERKTTLSFCYPSVEKLERKKSKFLIFVENLLKETTEAFWKRPWDKWKFVFGYTIINLNHFRNLIRESEN